MEFIEHLKAFDKLRAENLTPNAAVIYFHLFMVNNRCGWKEWFTESDLWIERSCGISRRETVIKALNQLKQKGFIDYERGTRKGQPTKYKILPLLNSSYDSSKDSAYSSSCDSGCDSSKDSGRDSDIPRLKTKDNRQVNKARAPEKKSYADNVSMTVDEYEKLKARFNGNEVAVKRCIEILDNYKGSKGKTYKDDYRAILSWVVDKYQKENGSNRSYSCSLDLPIHQGDDDFGLPNAV